MSPDTSQTPTMSRSVQPVADIRSASVMLAPLYPVKVQNASPAVAKMSSLPSPLASGVTTSRVSVAGVRCAGGQEDLHAAADVEAAVAVALVDVQLAVGRAGDEDGDAVAGEPVVGVPDECGLAGRRVLPVPGRGGFAVVGGGGHPGVHVAGLVGGVDAQVSGGVDGQEVGLPIGGDVTEAVGSAPGPDVEGLDEGVGDVSGLVDDAYVEEVRSGIVRVDVDGDGVLPRGGDGLLVVDGVVQGPLELADVNGAGG
ncbi:hypothetical protein OG827_39240 [Streptomyces sp. NBC_00272]